MIRLPKCRACGRDNLNTAYGSFCVTCFRAIPFHMRSRTTKQLVEFLRQKFASVRTFGGGRPR